MAFDPALANAISNTFRITIQNRLNTPQRSFFEIMLQFWFAIKNIRNVQLWTRVGAQTRNFISRNLGELEMDFRVFVADKFIQSFTPSYPTKQKAWRMPPTIETMRQIFNWLNDPYIRAYCTKIYFDGLFFILEYAADSDNEIDSIDLDSPEFEDLVE